MDTTDEATITAPWRGWTRRGRCSSSRARAAARSKPASMEKLFWDARVGARWASSGRTPLRRDHRSGHRSSRTLAERRGYRHTFRQPGRHRRPLLGTVALRPRARRAHRRAGARDARRRRRHGGRLQAGKSSERRPRARRVHRRRRQRRTRQADGRCCRRRCARSASGSSSSIAESTGKHGKGALPVVDEPLGRAGASTATIALRGDLAPIATRPTRRVSRRSRPPAIRCCA